MKKMFTLIAVAMMALGAQAQLITFTVGDNPTDGFANGDFKIAIVDTDGKAAIDANSQFFGTTEAQVNYKTRLKMGAKSGAKSSITLTIPAAGTLKLAPRSASSSATDRNLVITQNGNELYNKVVQDGDAVRATIEDVEKNVFPIVSVAVGKGEVTIGYPNGALNFYAFELVAGSDDAAITTVSTDSMLSNEIYNLAGQKVGAGFKGIVIKNGKKVVVK